MTVKDKLRQVAGPLMRVPKLGRFLYDQAEKFKYRRSLSDSEKGLTRYQNLPLNPEELSIRHETTLRCNLRCFMCYQADFREEYAGLDELTLEQIKDIYSRLKGKQIGLVGSEIFVRKDVWDLLDWLDERGVDMYLQTNGTLFKPQHFEKLKNYKHLKALHYSIDGPREDHDRIRGVKGSFDKTGRSIMQTKKLFDTGVNTVFLKENMDQLPETLKVAKDLKLNRWTFTFEEVYTSKEVAASIKIMEEQFGLEKGKVEINTLVRDEGFAYSFEEMEAALDKTIAAGLAMGVKVNFSPPIWYNNLKEYYEGTALSNLKLVCPKIINGQVSVDHKGNVFHCGMIRYNFGNLLEENLEDIWNKPEYLKFREKMIQDNLLPICKRCCKVQEVPDHFENQSANSSQQKIEAEAL